MNNLFLKTNKKPTHNTHSWTLYDFEKKMQPVGTRVDFIMDRITMDYNTSVHENTPTTFTNSNIQIISHAKQNKQETNTQMQTFSIVFGYAYKPPGMRTRET